MKLRTDNRGRLNGRGMLKRNATYEAKEDGARITLVEVPKGAIKTRLVRRNGRTYLNTNRPITNEDVAAAMADFP